MSKEDVFVIFPYLKTTKPVTVRGIHFRSSDDLEGLLPEQQQHLKTLFSMFFLRDDLHITHMIYALLELGEDQEEDQRLYQRLDEAQQLICYLCSTPQPPQEDPFLRREHSSLYTFWAVRLFRGDIWPNEPNSIVENMTKVVPPSEDFLEGYRGMRNWTSQLGVVAGCRIYPPIPRLSLNIREDLYDTITFFSGVAENWALAELLNSTESMSTEVEERIFTALEWHNKSTTDNLSEDDALVYLAIAFEALLDLEQGDALSRRFKETVMLLLGSIPRLDSWLEQFYRARSAVIHEGKSRHSMFYAVDWNKNRSEQIYTGKQNNQTPIIVYRSLTTYGRHIFRLCLITILSGARIAHGSRLSDLFVPNDERLAKIIALLNQQKLSPEKRLRSIVKEAKVLPQYHWLRQEHIPIDKVIAAGKLGIQAYLEMKPELSEETSSLIQTVLQQDKNLSELDKLRQFERLVTSMNAKNRTVNPFDQDEPFQAMLSLVAYATHPSFRARSWRSLQKKDE